MLSWILNLRKDLNVNRTAMLMKSPPDTLSPVQLTLEVSPSDGVRKCWYWMKQFSSSFCRHHSFGVFAFLHGDGQSKRAHMMIIVIMDIKVPFVLFPVIELHARRGEANAKLSPVLGYHSPACRLTRLTHLRTTSKREQITPFTSRPEIPSKAHGIMKNFPLYFLRSAALDTREKTFSVKLCRTRQHFSHHQWVFKCCNLWPEICDSFPFILLYWFSSFLSISDNQLSSPDRNVCVWFILLAKHLVHMPNESQSRTVMPDKFFHREKVSVLNCLPDVYSLLQSLACHNVTWNAFWRGMLLCALPSHSNIMY